MINILFVDDEPDLLELARISLEEAGGMSVDTTPSARQALDMFNQNRYDAIVSDFQMPDMDGIEFLQRIHTLNESVPVIIFTGKGRQDVVIDAINNGAEYYLEKSGDPEKRFFELRQKILLAVDRRRTAAKVHHFNRLYAIMSGINAAVLHTRSRDELFQKICRIAIDDGRFARAWIGLIDSKKTRVFPAACAGFGDETLAPVPVAAGTDQTPGGLSGRAAFQKRRMVNNMLSPPHQKSTDGVTQAHPISCSTAAFPIWFHNTVIGTFQVYERETEFFGSDETRMLEDICSDISFAIENIDSREQQEKTKQALVESEEKFRLLVEESLVGVYILQDNRFLHVNPKFAEIMGYSQEEIVNSLSVDVLIEPESRSIVFDSIQRRMNGDVQRLHTTFKGLRKDGRVIELEESGTAAVYHGRKILLGTIIDVTEQRRTEQERAEKLEELSIANRKIRAAEERLWAHIAALTESQERLNESERRMTDIINFLPDATFAIDTDGKVIVWNRAIEEMTGISAENILGRNNYEHAIPFYGKRRPLLADLVLKFEESVARTYPTFHRDGKKFTAKTRLPHFHGREDVHAWFVAAPLYDTQGNIAGAIETIRDITQFEEARNALQESRERYRSLISGTHDGVVIIRNGKIAYSNSGIRKTLAGYTENDLIGKAVAELIHPADREKMLQRIHSRMNGAVFGDSARFRALAKDGTFRYLESRAALIEWEGTPATVCFLSELPDPIPEDGTASVPAFH